MNRCAGISVVEGTEPLHYAAYQRDQRRAYGYADGTLLEIARRWFSGRETRTASISSHAAIDFMTKKVSDLVDGAFGGDVAFAGVHHVFCFLAFLIQDCEWGSVRGHEIDFSLCEIFRHDCDWSGCKTGCTGCAETTRLAERSLEFLRKLREPGKASGFFGKCLHLIFVPCNKSMSLPLRPLIIRAFSMTLLIPQ